MLGYCKDKRVYRNIARHVHVMCTSCARHVHVMCTSRACARHCTSCAIGNF